MARMDYHTKQLAIILFFYFFYSSPKPRALLHYLYVINAAAPQTALWGGPATPGPRFDPGPADLYRDQSHIGIKMTAVCKSKRSLSKLCYVWTG